MAAIPVPPPLPPQPAPMGLLPQPGRGPPPGLVLTQQGVDRINRVRASRGQPAETAAQMAVYYRRVVMPHPPIQLNPPVLPVPMAPPFPPLIPPLPVAPAVAMPDLDNTVKRFLRKYPKGLTAGDLKTYSKHWRGVRFLGQGAFGRVGLWSYVGPKAIIPTQEVTAFGLPVLPPGVQPVSQYVVVKESKPRPVVGPNGLPVRRRNGLPLMRPLSLENEFNATFARSVSEHSITCWRGYPRDRLDDDRNPMLRMFSEYLPMGNFYDLIIRRVLMGKMFSERTLWAMFNCLVDGVAVITDEQELDLQPGGLEYTRKQRVNAMGRATDGLHFDLKPDNILLGGLNARHSEPVLKISDYGLFREFRANVPFPNAFQGELDRREAARDLSDFNVRAPEQWTERWEYANILNGPVEPVAGQYSVKTNIWGIASVMFTAVTFAPNLVLQQRPDPAVPQHQQTTYTRVPDPYIPTLRNPPRPAHLSHGYELEVLPLGRYSVELKELLQECLYDDPGNRPTLEELKRRVMEGYRSSQTTQAGLPVDPEPFDDFLAYEDPELIRRRAGVAAPNPPPQVAPLTALEIINISGGRPKLPNPILAGQRLRCQATRRVAYPDDPLCANTYITDGIIANCAPGGMDHP